MSIQYNKRNVLKKELFIDNDFVEEIKGIKRMFHNPEKCAGNPVIPYDKPWEHKAAFVDTGLVLYDKEEKIFRAWYQGGKCLGKDDHSTMCYATSKDGIHWKKPSLGIIEFEGSKENNILLYEDIMMHDPSVIFDPEDTDVEKRYKVIWWGGRKGKNSREPDILGHCVAFSGDGIHWQPHPDNPVWVGDAEIANLFGLEHKEGKFIAFCSMDGYGMRVIGRTESNDFVNWQSPRLFLKSDDQDPPGTELTGLSAVDYYGSYIGMLYVIRRYPVPTRERWNQIIDWGVRNHTFHPSIAMNTGRAGKWTIHTELIFSRDGNTWQHINRKPFVPFGSEGSWDECLSLIARPLIVDNQIMFYYTGQGREENLPDERSKPTKDWPTVTGLATIRLDGFVSLDTGEQEGSVVTKPFKWDGTNIAVNADANSGYIKAEVCTRAGKPISGYTQEESRALTEDNLCQNLSWKNRADMSELKGREIKLRLLLWKCSLFSITWLR